MLLNMAINENSATPRDSVMSSRLIPDILLAASVTLALGLVLMIMLGAMVAPFWADLAAFLLSIGVGLVLLAWGRRSQIIVISGLYVLVMFVLLMMLQFGLAARAGRVEF
jgi:hypothetical protein